ncbi:MAG: cutinase family protein [Kineosporiaceae bacterium]
MLNVRKFIGGTSVGLMVPIFSGAALLATVGPAAAANPGCRDITFIGVRGSGETSGMGRELDWTYAEFGRQVDRLLKNAAGGPRTYRSVAVDYTAADVKTLVPIVGTTDPIEYLRSIADGEAALSSQISLIQESCPDTEMVIAGYSQGALVVHEVTSNWMGSQAVADEVVGVGLLADPEKRAKSNIPYVGTAKAGSFGVTSLPTPTGYAPNDPPAIVLKRTIGACDGQDIVCDFNHGRWSPLVGTAVHTEYANTKTTLDDLALQLAKLATAQAIPAQALQTFSAQRGRTFKGQHLEANVRTASLAKWRLDSGDLPAGLTLQPDGRITGTPTETGTHTAYVSVSGPLNVWRQAKVTITVDGPSVAGTLPTPLVGVLYHADLPISGGTPPYKVALTTGTLPTGLTLAGTTISGTPTTLESRLLTIDVRDANGAKTSWQFVLAVRPATEGGHPTTGPWLTTWALPYPGTIPPLKDAAVDDIEATSTGISVIYADGTAQRWSYIFGGWQGGDVPDAGVKKISAGGAYITDGSFVADWRMYCCQALGYTQLFPGETFTDVAGDRQAALALTSAGRVITGQNPVNGLAQGPDWVPAELSTARAVSIASSGGIHAAATSTGAVVVWALNPIASQQPPAGLCPTAKVRTYGVFGAICQDGHVEMWGAPVDDSKMQVPSGLTGVQDLAIGPDFVMALKTDGHVVSWGDGVTRIPDLGTGAISAIGAGFVGAVGR